MYSKIGVWWNGVRLCKNLDKKIWGSKDLKSPQKRLKYKNPKCFLFIIILSFINILYSDGTTDVTSTVHFGTPTDHEKRCFTRVLQGHIDLATTIFPKGTVGRSLDSIARLPLWKDGLEYRHGTGHGVGSFLNVHERKFFLF